VVAFCLSETTPRGPGLACMSVGFFREYRSLRELGKPFGEVRVTYKYYQSIKFSMEKDIHINIGNVYATTKDI
jgi:hypothetical protein